jgi:hypothetical protein
MRNTHLDRLHALQQREDFQKLVEEQAIHRRATQKGLRVCRGADSVV